MFTTTVGIGLTICADFSADIGDRCSIVHTVDDSDYAAFKFGDGSDSVELSFTAESLRAFLKLGAAALAEMDGLFAREQTAKAERQAVAARGDSEHGIPDNRQLVTIGEHGA